MNALLQLIVETFVHPREIAQSIISERFDRVTLWTGAFLVVLLVGILQFITWQVTPRPPTTPETEAMMQTFESLFATPFLITFIMGSIFLMSVFAVYLGGRMIGGTGDFPETLVVMSWLQFVNAATGSIVVVLLLISPQLGGVASLFSIMIKIGMIYATLHFIDVLHGYNSLWAAFGTLVISTIGLLVGLALILVLIGGTAAQTGAI